MGKQLRIRKREYSPDRASRKKGRERLREKGKGSAEGEIGREGLLKGRRQKSRKASSLSSNLFQRWGGHEG